MQVINEPRSAGKTTRAVEWVKQGRKNGAKDSSNRILVVMNESEKRRIMEVYDLGYCEVETWRTITRVYCRPAMSRTDIEVFVDNADQLLQAICPAPIMGISTTMESGS
ncbi:MAG: hypothetical protein QM390_05705 [Candidatus Thermoplasmatota archaeon]|nr:hypothetical protein [Candidatus Thermoplasmatota archaeon]